MYVGVDSGVPFDEECVQSFRDMKRNSSHKYIILKVESIGNNIKTQVVLDQKSKPHHVPANNNIGKHNFTGEIENHTMGLGLEPLLNIFGKLDLPDMMSLRTICKSWSKYIDENDERLLYYSLVSGKRVTPKFSATNAGFSSWRQFILERNFERENYKAVWAEVADILPENQCRFVIYRIHEPSKKPHFLFIQWAPDVAPVRQKMIYASTKMLLFRALASEGLQSETQACEKSELNYAQITRGVFNT